MKHKETRNGNKQIYKWRKPRTCDTAKMQNTLQTRYTEITIIISSLTLSNILHSDKCKWKNAFIGRNVTYLGRI